MCDLRCRACGRGPLADKRDTSVPTWWRHYGRGLDGTCYGRMRYLGRLADFDSVRPLHTHLVEDWNHLRACGITEARALAERIGVSVNTIRRYQRRHHAR